MDRVASARVRRAVRFFLGSTLFILILPSCDSSNSSNPTIPSAFDPSQPGPYVVGNTSLILEDASRPLGCGPGNRRLVVEVWYPAADEAGQLPENHIKDFMLDQLQAAIDRFGEDAMVDMPTGSYRDAALHPDAGQLPILIFSHGFSSNRFQNFTMADHLASHGYLVVSPDHTCNAKIAPLPEGAVFFSILDAPFTLWERIADVRFLIDVFTGNTPERFAGRVDATRIGVWGHSFGGITVTQTAMQDPRVSALLQLASFGFPPVPDGLSLASMYMYGYEDKWMNPFKAWHDQIIETMPVPKQVLNFYDTGHFAFSDLCVLSPDLAANGDGCGAGTRIDNGEPFQNPDHATMHQVMNPYALAFFGAALFGSQECSSYLQANHFPQDIDYSVYSK